jgi:hypothetical protein
MDILGDSLLTLTHVENQDISIAQHCSLSLCVSLSLSLCSFLVNAFLRPVTSITPHKNQLHRDRLCGM